MLIIGMKYFSRNIAACKDSVVVRKLGYGARGLGSITNLDWMPHWVEAFYSHHNEDIGAEREGEWLAKAHNSASGFTEGPAPDQEPDEASDAVEGQNTEVWYVDMQVQD